VQGCGCRFQLASRWKVQGSGLSVPGSGSRIQDLWFMIHGIGFEV